MGRFINADVFASTGQGLVGNNMFAYCNNNPVNCKDPNGQWLIGAIIGGVLGGASAIISGKSLGEVLIATVEGAVVGALAEEGGKLLIAGAAVHGVYTALTTEGDISTKIFKGTAAFGSTMFCGALGEVALSGIENVASCSLENIVVSSVYGVASAGFDYAIQQSEVPSGYTDWWDNTFNNTTDNTSFGTLKTGSARDPGFSIMYRQTEAVCV